MSNASTPLEYLKHRLIRTPLERPARAVSSVKTAWKCFRHPELRDVFTEHQAIDRILPRLIAPDSNCLDCGCHLGSMLSQMVRLSPKGTHMAFEPSGYKAAWLRRKFPEVTIVEAGVGREKGVARFYHYAEASGFDALRPDEKRQPTSVVEVPIVCLDEVVPADRDIHFIKVDVEGAEFDLFRGAEKLLRRCRPSIVFECTERHLKNFQIRPADVFAFLTDLGYRLNTPHGFAADQPPIALEQFERAMEYPYQAFNFVATAKP